MMLLGTCKQLMHRWLGAAAHLQASFKLIEAALKHLRSLLALAMGFDRSITLACELHGCLCSLDALTQQLIVGFIAFCQLLKQSGVLA